MTSKIKIFGQKFADFDHFVGGKSRFLDIFEVVLEFFRKCLGIVFEVRRPTFGFIFSSKVVRNGPKN